MRINQAYRYELKPNNKQVGVLLKHCGVARFAWNWALSRRVELYKTKEGKERFTNAINQQRELNILKKSDYPWMYEVSKCSPQSALQDLDRAYANFIRGHKSRINIGFPKFKKKGIHDSFRLCQTNGTIKVKELAIRLPRLNWVRTKESTLKLKGRILSATVSREADRWFVSLCVEYERPNPQPIQGDIVGIDLGLNNFAVISNGESIEQAQSPKPLSHRINKLQRLSKCHSRKIKGSNNRRKESLKLARLHRKVRNIRKDFLSKLTTSLAKTKSVIVLEDLNISGISRNHHLARSVTDVGWGEFRRMLGYKTRWYGSKLVVIGRFEPTSKTCSECGPVNHELKLSDRTWVCMACGMVHERDENAAKNIRQLGIKQLSTEGSSGIEACGVDVRPLAIEADHYEAGSKHICNK